MLRYTPLPASFHTDNRRKVERNLVPGSIALVYSSASMPRSADSDYWIFKQNPDLVYLTGIEQAETTLMLFPDAPSSKWKEVLFIKDADEHTALWEGEQLTKEKARTISGIQEVLFNSEMAKVMVAAIHQAEVVYASLNEHDRYVHKGDYNELKQVKALKERYPLHTFKRLAPIMHAIRSVKEEVEIDRINHAIKLTSWGFERVLRTIKPGMMEYQIEADITHEFLYGGAIGHAYHPIIASGANSCVLHYNTNHNQVKDGDLILLDFGADYGGYASDLSRTIPVNGAYTKRQRAVYDAVLSVHNQAKNMLRPGQTFENFNLAVGEIMTHELLELGLITQSEVDNAPEDKPAYKKYFMHGTSHFLGLDTHDVGNFYKPMEAGNVFTCEPGIYIPEERIGIRIENDILVTEEDPIDLMAQIPIEAEHIEYIMQGGR